MKKLMSILFCICQMAAFAQSHPSIMLTKQNLEAVRSGIKNYPILTSSYNELKIDADKAISMPVNVPTPADGGGGVTHEQHKNNYKAAMACGVVYQISKDERYAKYVRDMLMQYAKVYNTWGRHPKRKEQPGGKMFWQTLNDCVWLMYMIQSYDCVYDYIAEKDRQYLTDSLWSSVVYELSVVNSSTFNLIHNHATWSTAGVGMAGYVCGRKDWVDIALKGSKKDGTTGFLKQVDALFSPDGYYSEGPYYQRYAIQPFIVFARAIQQYQPELNIYGYRDHLLGKAVETSLQTTYTNKVFFPVNDALKDKTFESEELIYGVDIAYSDINPADDLLDIAQQQKRVIISDAGLKVAQAIAEGKTKAFVYKPMFVKDGAAGTKGGLGILRSGDNNNQTCVVMKAASQGMGHGHFDRLNILFYDNNEEIFSDYGSVRFLNVETKTGGGYTKENDTWAKTTIAHNTLVVDKTSHFKGNVALGEANAPSLIYFDANKKFQVVCAEENKAYDNIKMLRTAILFQPEGAESPLLIDVLKVNSTEEHRYDLPFWYQGHLTDMNFKYNNNNTQLNTMGAKNGYQHLWLNAEGKVNDKNGRITFLKNSRFYTTSFLADTSTQVEFVTVGANDPNYNLRSEKAFIITQPKANNHTFVNITEPHGKNNATAEYTVGFMSQIKNIQLLNNDENGSTFSFNYKNKTYTIQLQYNNKQQFITIK